MKIYKVELSIIDNDNVSDKEIEHLLENVRYPNHCISPRVVSIESREISDWSDDHPLNKKDTTKQAFKDLFLSADKKVLNELLSFLYDEISHMSCDDYQFEEVEALAELVHCGFGDFSSKEEAFTALSKDSSYSLGALIRYFIDKNAK